MQKVSGSLLLQMFTTPSTSASDEKVLPFTASFYINTNQILYDVKSGLFAKSDNFEQLEPFDDCNYSLTLLGCKTYILIPHHIFFGCAD